MCYESGPTSSVQFLNVTVCDTIYDYILRPGGFHPLLQRRDHLREPEHVQSIQHNVAQSVSECDTQWDLVFDREERLVECIRL